MQVTSQTYKDIIAGGEYSFEARLSVVVSESPISVKTYGMDELFSLSTDSKAFPNEPEIGGVYSATCEFSLLYDGTTIPRMARVIPQYRVTDGVNTSEWLNKGAFFIDSRSVTTGNGISVLNAFCYDRMSLANKPYTNSSLLWPAEDTDIVQEIAAALGVGVDGRHGSYINQGYLLDEPGEDATYRDYLSYIGVMYCGCWVISDAGLLLFIPMTGLYEESETLTVTTGDVESLETSPSRPTISKIVLQTSDEGGTDVVAEDPYIVGGATLEAYCPFATQTMAERILVMAERWGYIPYTASNVWADPSIELGDKINITDRMTGWVYSRSINFGQGMPMELSAPGQQDVDHEFLYESPEESRTDAAIGTLTAGLNNLGVRNLIINTKNPVATSQSEWPRLYKQKDNTRSSDWEASVATHGIRMTKGASAQTNAAFQMGGTSPGSSTASMNGLVAGETYTISYKFNYLVLPASTNKAFARWRLIYYTSNTAGATAQTVLLKKIEVTRDEAKSKSVSFTFTVPENAVVCALYFNFCDITDTNIPNSSFRSTDYYEFADMMLVQGNVAATWTPAPEDGVSETSETEPTNGTTKTYELDTNGTYLLTVARANSTVATYDGVYLVAVNTNSHVFNVAKGTNAPSPTISGHTLTVTTTVANQRITITRLS